MELKRIDHVGIVVRGLAEPAALLRSLGLELARTNRNDESAGNYFPCGDASIELIEVHDDESGSGGCRRAPTPSSSTSRSRWTTSKRCTARSPSAASMSPGRRSGRATR